MIYLVEWDSASLGVRVNILKDSSGIDIDDEQFGLCLRSEPGLPLWDLIYTLGLQFIVDIPLVSNVSYPDWVGSPLQYTIALPPSRYCPKFLTPTSGTCMTSPSRSTLAATLYGAWTTLPWLCGHIWHWRKARCDNKVQVTLEGSLGLGFFVVSTLSSSHVIWFLNGLLKPSSWDFTNFPNDYYFISTNLASSAQYISITNFSESSTS